MIVARNAHRLRQALVMDCGFEHHALVELGHHLALDLLPRRLALGIGEPAVLGERGAALVQLRVRDQDIGGAFLQIDAHPVAGLDQRQSAARRGLRRSVQDRGRAGGARLPAVADAGQRVHAFLEERRRRLHVDHFRPARVADRPGAANEQNAVFVDLELRVVDAVVIILGAFEHDRPALERVRVFRVGEETGAELLIDHARLHDRVVEQIAAQDDEAGVLFEGLVDWHDDVGIVRMNPGAVFSNRLAVDGQRLLMDELALHELVDDRRNAAGPVILLAEVFAGRLHVHEQRHLVADRLPILDRQRHADVAGDGVDVDRRIGRTADGAVDDNAVLERLTGENVRRFEVLPHHFDDSLASPIGDLAAFAVGRRDRGAAGQAHAERFGERVHGRGGAHRVAMADRGRRGGDDLHELLVVDLAFGEVGARLPNDGARAGALTVMPAVEHRAAGEDDGGNVDRRGRHDAGRRRLVAAGCQHDAVEEIAHQDFDEAEIGEIAVERRGRPLAGLLNRMHRKFEGQPPSRCDPVADAFGEFEVVAVAGRKIGAGLGDADDRLAGAQFAGRQAEIEVALDIERRHSRIVRIVEPEPGSQRPLGVAFCAAARFALGFLGHRCLLPARLARALTCQYGVMAAANQRFAGDGRPSAGLMLDLNAVLQHLNVLQGHEAAGHH